MMSHKILIPILLSCFFISCSSDDDDDIRKELNSNRQLWETSQIENYKWNERLSCFCGGLLAWDVFVAGGVKEKVEFDETLLHENQTYEDVFDNAKTVEDAFQFIETLFNQEVASITIEYDEVYGFPKLISIDYVENIADDEIAYLYTDFEIQN